LNRSGLLFALNFEGNAGQEVKLRPIASVPATPPTSGGYVGRKHETELALRAYSWG